MSDQVDEEFVPEGEDEQGPVALKGVREKLAVAVKEKQEYLEGWQRARADFANFKKDEALMHIEREARIRAELAEAIIPTLDSFEMAFTSPSFAAGDLQWQTGMKALYQGLLESLGRVGVGSFSPVGEKFNPHRHEALREVETSDARKNHSIESVLRSGYTVGEKVVRPAQVSVYTLK